MLQLEKPVYLKLTKATRSPCSFVLMVHSCHNFLVLLFI